MKILDVTEFYSERGGGVRSHLSLKGHVLCQLGHEHVVVAPGAEDDVGDVKDCSSRLARSGQEARGGARRARVVRIRGPASPYDPTYHLLLRFDKIRAIVERERPDVLEIHSPYLAAAGALRATPGTYGIRTFQWHSDFIDTYAGVLDARLSSLPSRRARRGVRAATRPVRSSLWTMVRAIARRCDATLVASTWQVAKLAGHGIPRVVHQPFGIERDVFRADARDATTRRELLAGRDDETPIVVAVGRFAIEKRWDVVLDAFLRVRARRDAVLVLLGDGPERARMQARAAGSTYASDILFRGFVRDRAQLARLLASGDALLHACPHETFGLAIAEAMSCGLPVVVPDEGGAAEMFEPASGERYEAEDVDACAAALTRLLDRVASNGGALRAAATRAASRLPSVREQFEMQVALYTELLAGRTDAGLAPRGEPSRIPA